MPLARGLTSAAIEASEMGRRPDVSMAPVPSKVTAPGASPRKMRGAASVPLKLTVPQVVLLLSGYVPARKRTSTPPEPSRPSDRRRKSFERSFFTAPAQEASAVEGDWPVPVASLPFGDT